MSDGDLRRAPLLWEQRLQAMIPNVGVQGVADAEVLGDSPPGPGAGDEEPSEPPVLDEDPATPRVPSAPVVASVTLGLVITWDGRDFDGDVMPVGSYVDVHVDTVSGFTPDSSNLVGRITGEGSFAYTAGTAGTTYYVKFVGFGPDGGQIGESAQASASPGLIQGPEINGDAVITQILSDTTPATTFALGSIWLNTSNGSYNVLEDVGGTPTWVTRPWDSAGIATNAITANQIAAQAILTKFLTGEVIRTGATDSARVQISAAGGIEVFRDATTKTFWAKPTGEVVFGSASVSTGGTTVINGDAITTGTITGRVVQTSSGDNRVQLSDSGSNFGDSIAFYNGGTRLGAIYGVSSILGNFVYCSGDFFSELGLTTNGTVTGASVYTPGSITALGSITTSAALDGARCVIENSVGSGATGVCYYGERLGSPAAGEALMRLRSNHTTLEDKFQVLANGDVKSRTNSYGGISDARIKENIRDARGYLEDLRRVQVRKFTFSSGGDDHLGVVAQELQQVFPGMVGEDADGMLYVKTSVFTPMLVTAVQELAAKVDDLESRIAAQQAQIDALTARLDSLQ